MIDIPQDKRAGWLSEANEEGGVPLPGDTEHQARLRYVSNRLHETLRALEETEAELAARREEIVALKAEVAELKDTVGVLDQNLMVAVDDMHREG